MSIEVRNLHKTFGNFAALNNVSLDFPTGELVALLGPSGCGKTTLLRIIAGLENPDNGSVLFHGEDATDVHVRERNVGFVFQHHNLILKHSVLSNVLMGRLGYKNTLEGLFGVFSASEKELAKQVLEEVGLKDHIDRRVDQLSGGQQQRVAVARALATHPKLILADEPTANLDTENGKQVMDIMQRLNKETGVTFVFATHDPRVIGYANRVITLEDGLIVKDAGFTT